MTRHSLQSVRRRSAAFTLIELILALSVVVALAALAAPSLWGAMASQRLRSAAEHVRAAWVDARCEAMTTGKIYVFRFQPDTGDYTVDCWEGLEAGATSADDGSAPGGATTTFAGAAPGAGPGGSSMGASATARHLPEGVVFVASQQLSTARAALLGAESGSSDLSGAAAAPPVLFYADGSTSTVELQVADDQSNYVTVSMRGETGVVTVSPIASDEEAPQ